MSDKEHARFSPSSAHRRIACPGSLALEEQVPRTTSDYAEEGTAAHELMEWAFRDNATFLDNYEGKKTKNGWKVNKEMISAVQIFVDTIRATAANFERMGATVHIFCEERVSFAHFMGDIVQDNDDEDFFGTSDIIIVAEFADGTALVSIHDLKYGKGVKVYAEENEQMFCYALGVLAAYTLAWDVRRVQMCIHQPRIDHVDEWEVPVARVYEFAEQLAPAAQLALRLADEIKSGKTTVKKLDKAGRLVPGEDQCQFCRAKAHCPAKARFVLKAVDDMFENLEDDVDVKGAIKKMDDGLVTIDQVEKFGLILEELEDWIKAVRGRIQAELYRTKNGKLKRWKLVKGRKGHRAWKNLDEAERLLKKFRTPEEKMFKRELISPTQAEALFGNQVKRWKQLQKNIEQPDGKLSIAPMKDKRQAVPPPNFDGMFEDLSEDGDFDDLA